MHDDPRDPIDQPTIVLMPVDIELFLVTTGGVLEPRVEWTESALLFSSALVKEIVSASSAQLIPYRAPEPDRADTHDQLKKLHELVGTAILNSKVPGNAAALPTLRERFDWTLGERAHVLAEDSGADYALFVYIRDSYASGGRQAVIAATAITTAVLFGAPVLLPGGQQVGFASLVDLRDGDIMWFNFLASTSGDLRKEAPARKAMQALLDGIPL